MGLSNIFRSEIETPVLVWSPDNVIMAPWFDDKYKTVIKMDYIPDWISMIHWANDHSSGDVLVKFENQYGYETIFLAFEDSDDAILFKLKFSIC